MPECRVELAPAFALGLRNLEGISHLILLYWLDRTGPMQLTITPPFDGIPRGIFATRAPVRPNPIGLAVVQLDRIDGTVLHIRGLDCIDGTPLLDIKPYLPSTDSIPDATTGWLAPHTARRHDQP